MLSENLCEKIVELRRLLSDNIAKRRYSETELAAIRDELHKLTEITKTHSVSTPLIKETFSNHT